MRTTTSPRPRLSLVLTALGDSLLGAPIAEALGLPRDTARELAAERLRARLESAHRGVKHSSFSASARAQNAGRVRQQLAKPLTDQHGCIGGPDRELGPGLITGAADDDPSGIATYSQAGAQFGYGLLWTMLLTYPLMSAVQLVSAHIGRVTGAGLASNLVRSFPELAGRPADRHPADRQHHQHRRRSCGDGGIGARWSSAAASTSSSSASRVVCARAAALRALPAICASS